MRNYSSLKGLLLICLIFILNQTIMASSITIPANTIISSSSIWNTDTIKINGNITISSTGNLTIMPRTVVLIMGYYSINISGKIKAIGAVGDTILFTRLKVSSDTLGFSNSSSTNGSWAGINLSTSTNQSDSSIFRYCKFQFIKKASVYNYGGISFSSGNKLIIARSNFSNNQAGIFTGTNTTLRIDSCVFYRNFYFDKESSYYYYYNDIIASSAKKLIFQNSTLYSCAYKAINIIGGNSDIAKCIITRVVNKKSNQSFDNLLDISSEASVFIKSNIITGYNNIRNGISLTTSKANIDNNTITKFLVGIDLLSSSSGKIVNNQINNCGDGIGCGTSFFRISNNIISSNSNRAFFINSFAKDTLDGNIIKSNVSGIYIRQSEIVLINNKIVNQTNGYGIYIDKSNVEIFNCLIANNRRSSYGSAIESSFSTVNITNSTIANNKDDDANYAPLSFTSTSGEISNCIIYGNVSNITSKQVYIANNTVQPSFYNCNVQNGSPQFVLGSGISFTGKYQNCIDETLTTSLNNPTGGAGSSYDALGALINWAPKTTSLCINAGDNSRNKISTDLTGKNRIQNGIIDLGAIETRVPKMTYPGDDISSNVRWIADTVLVNNSFSILNNGTLNISPGVKVLFSGNFTISCSGYIKATGTESAPIIFSMLDNTNYNLPGASGGWGGINISGGVAEADTCFLRYCKFNYLKGTIKIANRNMVAIEHNIFNELNGYNTLETAFDFGTSAVKFNYNELSNFKNYTTEMFSSNSCNLQLLNNKFYNNNTKNLLVFGYTDIEFVNNSLYNNTCNNSYLLWVYNSKAYFVNNLIFNNVFSSISISNMVSNYIGNNTIANNNCTNTYMFDITNTIFENNIIENNVSFRFNNNSFNPNIYRNNLVSTNTIFDSGTCLNCIYENNPLFKSSTSVNGPTPQATNADWQLTDFSKAINTGSGDISQLFPTDINGNKRINSTLVDIGAIEHQGSLPVIINQPQGGSYCNYEDIELSVDASTNVLYQWLKDGKIIQGETNSTILLQSVSIIDQGSYTCKISNGYGSITSSAALVNILTSPEILSTPESRFISSGSQVNIEIPVTGTKPMVAEWYKDDILSSELLKPELRFGSFDAQEEGNYKLIIKNSCGSDTSGTFALNVLPISFIKDNDSLICEGQAVSLTTTASEGASYQWYKNGIIVKGSISNELNFNSITKSDEGAYSCLVENSAGKIETGRIIITIHKGPSTNAIKEINYVDESLKTHIEVTAYGDEPINYQWFKNGTAMNNETSAILNLPDINTSDEASYLCKISNACGYIETNSTNLVIAPQLCMVTSNIQNDINKNYLIWDRNSSFDYDHYNIYRESYIRGEYQKIGEVPYRALTTFIDSFVNPKSQAYVYKITITDNAGMESDINATTPHKIIHLLVSQGIPSGIQLDWDEYMGFDYKTYHIFRSENNGNFENVHDMSSTTRTWTDFDALSTQNLRYFISVDRENPCIANSILKAGAGPLSSSTSNMEDNSRLRTTEIADIKENQSFTIYPNPFASKAKVNYIIEKASKVEIILTDISGKQLEILYKGKQLQGKYQIEFGDKLSKGVYLMKLNINERTSNYKFLKL